MKNILERKIANAVRRALFEGLTNTPFAIAYCEGLAFEIPDQETEQFVLWNGIWHDGRRMKVDYFVYTDTNSKYTPTYPKGFEFGVPYKESFDRKYYVVRNRDGEDEEQLPAIYNYDCAVQYFYCLTDKSGYVDFEKQFETHKEASDELKRMTWSYHNEFIDYLPKIVVLLEVYEIHPEHRREEFIKDMDYVGDTLQKCKAQFYMDYGKKAKVYDVNAYGWPTHL